MSKKSKMVVSGSEEYYSIVTGNALFAALWRISQGELPHFGVIRNIEDGTLIAGGIPHFIWLNHEYNLRIKGSTIRLYRAYREILSVPAPTKLRKSLRCVDAEIGFTVEWKSALESRNT